MSEFCFECNGTGREQKPWQNGENCLICDGTGSIKPSKDARIAELDREIAELRLQAIADLGQIQTALEERDAARAALEAKCDEVRRLRGGG